MKKYIVLGVLVLLAATTAIWLFFGKDTGPKGEPRSFFAFIRNAEGKNNSALLTVDEVEFLSGEEAVAKGMVDTGCARDRISDCIPSMNNDFYIRNIGTSTEEMRLSDSVRIETLESPGSPVLVSSTVAYFLLDYADPSKYMDKLPFRFTVRGNEIEEVSEQYIP